MLQEKAGEIAGKIWETLNENGEMSGKDLKKAVILKQNIPEKIFMYQKSIINRLHSHRQGL